MYLLLKRIQKILINQCYLLALFSISFMCAQTFEITGTVIDQESNLPLPGVTISVIGESKGVITDFDGNYVLKVSNEERVLRFSYLGFETQNIKVGKSRIINVTLNPESTSLDEVVVVGYGTVKKSDLTGAVSTVKGSDFQKANPISFQEALSGRVSGVQITQADNAPGAGAKILIRGGSSLTSGNQPLFVIDGFPIVPVNDNSSNPLADLSPSNIESVEVLKDASATAVFGAQGANGVIIVTTKKGKKGKPQFTIDSNTSISTLANTPDILNPRDYIESQITGAQLAIFQEGASNQYLNRMLALRDSNAEGTVWLDELTRQAATHQIDLSFRGASETMRYGVSGNFLDQEGLLKGNDFDRLNISANLEQEFGSRAKIGVQLNVSTSKMDGAISDYSLNSIFRKAIQTNPFIPLDYDIGNVDVDAADFESNNDNLITYINEVDQGYETTRTIANAFFEYDITKNLKFYTSYGFNKFVRNQFRFYPSSVLQGLSSGGEVLFRKQNSDNGVFQSRLNYNNSFNKHRLDVTAVFETRDNSSTAFQTEVQNFDDDSRGIYDLSSAAVALIPSNIFDEDKLVSYLGRVNYSYAGKYFLTLSYRADGSSRFGADNKFGFFPSAALAWTLSNEKFLKNVENINLLKLRASFGVTGNNQIPNYSALARLNTAKYPFGGSGIISGFSPGSVANPDLKWEETAQYNLGLDLQLFKNRIAFSAEAYYKETTDLLLDVQLPFTSGFTTALQNVGSLSNKGLEFSLNTVNVKTDNFSWTSNFTLSFNRAEVLDLGEKSEFFFSRGFYQRVNEEVIVRVGEQIGVFYGYVEDEVYNNATEIANSPNNPFLETVPGNVKFKDLDGDGVITTNDQAPIANTSPEFIGGLSNNLVYKNWDLNFFWRWSYGNDVINANLPFVEQIYQGSWNTLYSMAENAWTPSNPNGTFHGRVPNTYLNYMRSSYVEDGSFLKLDFVTLGYKLPQQTLDKLGISNFRVYTRVNNPLMFTRYSWFDPEVNTGFGTAAQVGPGVDLGAYPRATVYTLGLTVTF